MLVTISLLCRSVRQLGLCRGDEEKNKGEQPTLNGFLCTIRSRGERGMSAGDSDRFLEREWSTASVDYLHLTMSAPTPGVDSQESPVTLILVKSHQRLISDDTAENIDAHQGTAARCAALGEPVKINSITLRTNLVVIHT